MIINRVSILIPLYNWDISLLLHSLCVQIDRYNLPFFIIVADDASTISKTKDKNLKIIRNLKKEYIYYYPLEKNIGRAKIRNFLFEKANTEYVLFLDADTLPDSNLFLHTYFNIILKTSPDIVLGGISYIHTSRVDKKYSFYKYMGEKLGVIPASIRSIEPWRYIITSNLLIKSKVFETTPLDNRFTGYGYEDTEWGIRLIKDFNILHIENSVSHLGLETKNDLLSKLLNSSKNFHQLINQHERELKQWKLIYYVNSLSAFPNFSLSILSKILSFVFKYCPVHFISLYLYQIIKVIHFAKTKNTYKS